MLHFTVTDPSPQNAGCVTCCCESVQLKPGVKERLSVGYAIWAMPIGTLHCEPRFSIEQMDTCRTATTGNLPPRLTGDMAKFNTGTNVRLDADLRNVIADPEGLELVFKHIPLYGPTHGEFKLQPIGAFAYIPSYNFKGEERFYVTANDGINSPVVFEIMIAVGINSGLMFPTPHISINAREIVIDPRYYTVSFPIQVSPAAKDCEVWRLTVLQGALDCNCTCYARTDCFDIKIASCGR